MSDTGLLLPSSSTPLERDLSASMNALPRLKDSVELIRTAKRENIPDSVVPFLIYEYGLGELLPYLSDPRTAIATGVLWQRLRGTPQSFRIALGWINNDGIIEESEGGTSRWSQFQLGLDSAPVDLSQTDSVVEIGRLSSPVRSSLFRIYGGWYDGRRFNLDDHKLSGLDTLCDHTGVYLKSEWPQLSFGRIFQDEEGDISSDLEGALGIHRQTAIRGLYEDRTYLSNSVLGETSWRTLHIEDLSSVISRLHFSISGPFWMRATDWDVQLDWGQLLDWAGLQNQFTPALKFAKAGIYLGDGEVLGDTNACLPARFLEEFGDGAIQLSEGDPTTGEGILSEHLSRVEFTEINERFEQQTQLGSMWVSGNTSQTSTNTFQLQHGVAYASTSHPNPPEHATLITTLSHYNSTRNNRHDTSQTVFGDGAGHTLGRGEDFTPLGLTSFADGDASHGYPERFDLSTLVIDEAAGTISAVDTNGTTHTRPLFNQDGIRRVTEFRNAYSDNTAQVFVGAPITLVPSHREHTATLAYDDSFELSRSRLSEYTPIPNVTGIKRDHTTSADQFEHQSDQWQDTASTWGTDATGTWETVASYFDSLDFGSAWDQTDTWETGEYFEQTDPDTWGNTYSWQNFPQFERLLSFSRTMLVLSENGHLSDTDAILGDTHATLGHFEAERFERSHQTTSTAHNPGGFWYHLRERFATLAYDDLFELSRTRLSEHIPLFNEQAITREHGYTGSLEFFQANGWNDTSSQWDAKEIVTAAQLSNRTPIDKFGRFARVEASVQNRLQIGDRVISLVDTSTGQEVISESDGFTIQSFTLNSQGNRNGFNLTDKWYGIASSDALWTFEVSAHSWDSLPGYFDAAAEPTWYEAYSWTNFPLLEQVLNFNTSGVYLSETTDGLSETHHVLGFPTSERFERDYFAQATENRQSFTTRQHTRTVQTTVPLYVEPTWANGTWSGDGTNEAGWVINGTVWTGDATEEWSATAWGTDQWAQGSLSVWDTNNWLANDPTTWADHQMWVRMAGWQIASLVVEAVHETHA